MNFYTNVLQYGNSILVREVRDGERLTRRVKYEPTLFDLVTTGEETGYKTLDGKNVLPHKLDSIKEAKQWISNSENQNVVFGNTQYSYCWIADEYPNRVAWDLDQMLMYTIDIEVECENGLNQKMQQNLCCQSLSKITRPKILRCGALVSSKIIVMM